MKRLLSLSVLLAILMVTSTTSVAQVNISQSGLLTARIQGQGVDLIFESFALQQLAKGSRLVASSIIQPPGQSDPLILFQDIRLSRDFTLTGATLLREFQGQVDTIKVSVTGNTAEIVTTSADGKTTKKSVESDSGFILLSTNSLSQYQLAVDRIQVRTGDKMEFTGIIPEASLAVPVTAQRLGQIQLRTGGNPFMADGILLKFKFNNTPVQIRIFSIKGMLIGFSQQRSGAPLIIAFRSDLFPEGIEVEKGT